MGAEPVVVIGGSLAGLAAAARLAKRGNPVELFEARDQPGGDWRPVELSPGLLVDGAPAVLGFPAPWRDLFRKSGRPLEAELARSGYALVPAEPPRYRFADGSELVLPTDRGEQYEALTRAFGSAAADRWRDLLDGLGTVWQALRPLGLEDEFAPPRRFGRSPLPRSVRTQLRSRQSLAQFATETGHPRLESIVRSLAHRLGSAPEQTPALAAVELWSDRTFGRWQIAPVDDPHGPGAGRSSVLIEALIARLALRRVTVRTGAPVTERPGGTVVSAVDPWTTARLAGVQADPGWRPALAPTITHQVSDEAPGPVAELIELTADGVPTITYRRPVADGMVLSVHDHTTSRPAPRVGLAGSGFPGWLRRPRLLGPVPGIVQVGPWSAVGPGPGAQLQTGALATYAITGKTDA